MNIEYIKCGDYFIPNLRLPSQPEEPLTKYGRMRLNYLKGIPSGNVQYEAMIQRYDRKEFAQDSDSAHKTQ